MVEARDMRTPAPAPRTTVAPRLDARTVLQGSREVILVHGAEEYRLKVTAAGKLILTK